MVPDGRKFGVWGLQPERMRLQAVCIGMDSGSCSPGYWLQAGCLGLQAGCVLVAGRVHEAAGLVNVLMHPGVCVCGGVH